MQPRLSIDCWAASIKVRMQSPERTWVSPHLELPSYDFSCERRQEVQSDWCFNRLKQIFTVWISPWEVCPFAGKTVSKWSVGPILVRLKWPRDILVHPKSLCFTYSSKWGLLSNAAPNHFLFSVMEPLVPRNGMVIVSSRLSFWTKNTPLWFLDGIYTMDHFQKCASNKTDVVKGFLMHWQKQQHTAFAYFCRLRGDISVE